MLRISLPGQPTVFELEHYFLAGDRGSPIMTVKPAGSNLAVLKPTSTYRITGTSQLNFGILPLYELFGSLGSRLAISVEGQCYAWGMEGPWVTSVSRSQDLEALLDLEAVDPADLPAASDFRDAFAIYVQEDRVIQWHFGPRVYTLHLGSEGVKWSFRTFPAVMASGGFLYGPVGSSVTVDTNPPTGHPTIEKAAAFDGTATIEWENHGQDGNEFLETWIKRESAAWSNADAPDQRVSTEATQTFEIRGLDGGAEYTVAVLSLIHI